MENETYAFCAQCGSDDIRADASLCVNANFAIADVYDGWTCNNCENESDFDEIVPQNFVVTFTRPEDTGFVRATLAGYSEDHEGVGFHPVDALVSLLLKLDTDVFDGARRIELTTY